ncbi:MAG: phosphoglucosamine mutase [Salinivirgaceae bacterium]|jgi:phosphomannomutase|nr:phosphoglucosamine mutase [Bacteroidales bacterium]
MALIVSISGIRGTIGGKPGNSLTPIEIVNFSSAYSRWLSEQEPHQTQTRKVVIGRDARVSGPIVSQLVSNTLMACGVDIIDLGLATTPTVEMAVTHFKAQGGIIITASHNPAQWNALKLLNSKGEFISGAEGNLLLRLIENSDFEYATYDKLGKYSTFDFTQHHIDSILKLPLVDVESIKSKKYKVVFDAINSVGSIAIPPLLEQLGVECVVLNGEPNGIFAHNPEPLEKHLGETLATVKAKKADMGIVVDPDVDRLAFIDEHGVMFGEEYTLVAIADYVLQHTPGNTVSNLSSSRALSDITAKHGQKYTAAAVGEVNVVEMMKKTNAVIGGEGNGGIIYPPLHYGRDALVGIALFLSHLSKSGKTVSQIKQELPLYFMEKTKVDLNPETDVDNILKTAAQNFKSENINSVDGVKIDFKDGWVHLRKSNTEPIIRIYAEAKSEETVKNLIGKVLDSVGLKH